ncbi:hypothetical protein D922_01537 [Enterococcus faecalis 06-MB-DW-09]|nr:hypothetical protein D922_01537 [Enterococcus faecalis 06-MB-DW-09]
MRYQMSAREELIEIVNYQNSFVKMGHRINFDSLCSLIATDDALCNSRSKNQKVCVTIVNKYMTEEECQIILEKLISESEDINN